MWMLIEVRPQWPCTAGPRAVVPVLYNCNGMPATCLSAFGCLSVAAGNGVHGHLGTVVVPRDSCHGSQGSPVLKNTPVHCCATLLSTHKSAQ